jgi:glucuronate isomerase
MKPFITDTFLLQNKYAEELYFNYAEKQPIIDYHNHLIPKDIAENTVFDNISKVWIAGDHYKWRAMRTMGVNENSLPEILQIKKNLKRGLKPFRIL